MKKLLVLLLAAMMTFSLVACGGKDTDTDADANANKTNTEANVNTEVDTETEVETEADTTVESTVPAFDCDWIATITFNEDGTFKFEVADYEIVEEGTWAVADGVLTVTKPSGNTCESVVEDGVCKLNYVADASDQLVGQFYTSNYAFLDANTAAASSAPAFVCDWEMAEVTFAEDGTFTLALPDYQIEEVGTWVANEDGTYTVTSPAGVEYTSYVGEDGLVHLDYTADVNAQLVAQMYIAE